MYLLLCYCIGYTSNKVVPDAILIFIMYFYTCTYHKRY